MEEWSTTEVFFRILAEVKGGQRFPKLVGWRRPSGLGGEGGCRPNYQSSRPSGTGSQEQGGMELFRWALLPPANEWARARVKVRVDKCGAACDSRSSRLDRRVDGVEERRDMELRKNVFQVAMDRSLAGRCQCAGSVPFLLC